MFRKGIRLFVLTALVCCTFHQVGFSLNVVDLCVDPGHGGTQSGTVTHISGYNEEHVNRQVALALKDRVTHQSIS